MKLFMLFIVNPIAFPHDPHFHEDMVWERVESFIFFFQIFLCVLCAFAVNRYGKSFCHHYCPPILTTASLSMSAINRFKFFKDSKYEILVSAHVLWASSRSI